MKFNQSCPGIELVSPCPYPVTITITPRAPPILSIDRALSGDSTPAQSGPGSDGNKRVLHIPHSSSITETSPSDCLVSYPGLSLWVGTYLSSEVQSVYYTVTADWVIHRVNVKTVLFQIIQFSISTQFWCQTLLFRAIQFSISTQFKCQNSSILNNSV